MLYISKFNETQNRPAFDVSTDILSVRYNTNQVDVYTTTIVHFTSNFPIFSWCCISKNNKLLVFVNNLYIYLYLFTYNHCPFLSDVWIYICWGREGSNLHNSKNHNNKVLSSRLLISTSAKKSLDQMFHNSLENKRHRRNPKRESIKFKHCH